MQRRAGMARPGAKENTRRLAIDPSALEVSKAPICPLYSARLVPGVVYWSLVESLGRINESHVFVTGSAKPVLLIIVTVVLDSAVPPAIAT